MAKTQHGVLYPLFMILVLGPVWSCSSDSSTQLDAGAQDAGTYDAVAPDTGTYDAVAPDGAAPQLPFDTWVGPMPFRFNSTDLRDDLSLIWDQPDSWAGIRGEVQVFKSYAMLLHPNVGADLDSLVSVVNDAGLDVAFETAGFRYWTYCETGGGALSGQWELDNRLGHWLAADGGQGQVHYVTTDHTLRFALRDKWLAENDPTYTGPWCDMTLEELASEQAGYYQTLIDAIPGLEVGAIESTAGFSITGDDGTVYPTIWPPGADFPFIQTMDALMEAMTALGISLHHYHMDFGLDGVEDDGMDHPESTHRIAGNDYGRLMAEAQYMQLLGVLVAPVVNASPYGEHSVPWYDTEEERIAASLAAGERTRLFLQQYIEAGVPFDHFVLQYWHTYPHLTGPQTVTHSSMGLFASSLQLLRNHYLQESDRGARR